MNSNFFLKVSSAVSTERLDAYRQDGANEITTLGRYLWNVAVCESLYSPLQMVEIALRNAAHSAFSKHYGTNTWYDSAPLTSLGQEQLGNAKRNITKAGKTLTSGRLVAELNFGFWTAFFNNAHATTGMGAIILKGSFSNCLKSNRNQKTQEQRWDRIRRLRNRIFHHERIIHWKDLPVQHQELLETIGWISPELEDMSRRLDRFMSVHKDGVTPWIGAICNHWPRELP